MNYIGRAIEEIEARALVFAAEAGVESMQAQDNNFRAFGQEHLRDIMLAFYVRRQARGFAALPLKELP